MPYVPGRTIGRSLRFRLLFWNTMVVLLMVFPTLFAVRAAMQHTLLEEFDRSLTEDVEEIQLALRQVIADATRWNRIERFLNRKKEVHRHGDWFARIMNPTGTLIISTQNAPEEEFDESDFMTSRLIQSVPYRIRQAQAQTSSNEEIQIQVGVSELGLQEDVRLLTRMMILAGGLMLVVAPLGCYLLAGMATKPIAEIIRTTSRLRPAQLDERLPLYNRGDELDQLSLTINGLLDRLAIYVNEKRDLLANAAHQLRSPLAAIRGSVEVALNNQRSNEEYVLLLEEIMEECSDLGILVNQLLLLTESENEVNSPGKSVLSLDRTVRKSLNMFQGVAEAAGIELAAPRLDPALVRGAEHHLQQVINNLIDNAIKFTPPPGKVEVEIQVQPDVGQVILKVRDTGTGIAPEDQSRIFERFYRADQARQRGGSQRGNGLGLAICQSMVNLLGGTIRLESQLGIGSTFRVSFPLVPAGNSVALSGRLEQASRFEGLTHPG